MESSHYTFDHVVLDTLQHVDELFALVSIGLVPQLTSVSKDGQADRIEDQTPVGHRESPDRVTQDGEGTS